MFTSLKIFSRMLAATLAIAGLLLPAVASAQYAPSYGQPQGYGQPQYGQPQEETIHGRIYSINATFNITITDDNGYMDNVDLHQGTIINPTGLTLAPGMEVTIVGYGNGSAFEAMEIDTPYAYAGPAPVSEYYGPGWWYPGYSYGYGPSFVLDFVFGGGGGYRYERHGFDRNFWAARSDNRFRGGNGFAPRTGYYSNGNRGSWSNGNHGNTGYRNNNNNGYTAPTRTYGNPNGNTGYRNNNNNGYTAPTRTYGNPNGNANYGARNGGNTSGNTGYRSAPQQSRSANTRSAGANESRSTHTSDNGNQNDHSHGH